METREETPLDKARKAYAEKHPEGMAAKFKKEAEQQTPPKTDAPTPAPEAKPEQKKPSAPRHRKTLDEREKELAERRDALNKELAEIRAEKGKRERRERNHLLILFGSYFEKEIKEAAKWQDREKNDEEVKKLAAKLKAKISP